MDECRHACAWGKRDGQLVPAHCPLQGVGITAGGIVFGELSEPRREVCWEWLVTLLWNWEGSGRCKAVHLLFWWSANVRGGGVREFCGSLRVVFMQRK